MEGRRARGRDQARRRLVGGRRWLQLGLEKPREERRARSRRVAFRGVESRIGRLRARHPRRDHVPGQLGLGPVGRRARGDPFATCRRQCDPHWARRAAGADRPGGHGD